MSVFPGSRRMPGAGNGPLERGVQREVRRTLAQFGFESFHIPNGAQLAGDDASRARQMRALRADGLMPGFPDLGVIGRERGPSRGGIGFMEVKRAKGGRVSPDQRDCHAMLLARGVRLAVVRGGEDAIASLYEWGWL